LRVAGRVIHSLSVRTLIANASAASEFFNHRCFGLGTKGAKRHFLHFFSSL